MILRYWKLYLIDVLDMDVLKFWEIVFVILCDSDIIL